MTKLLYISSRDTCKVTDYVYFSVYAIYLFIIHI